MTNSGHDPELVDFSDYFQNFMVPIFRPKYGVWGSRKVDLARSAFANQIVIQHRGFIIDLHPRFDGPIDLSIVNEVPGNKSQTVPLYENISRVVLRDHPPAYCRWTHFVRSYWIVIVEM